MNFAYIIKRYISIFIPTMLLTMTNCHGLLATSKYSKREIRKLKKQFKYDRQIAHLFYDIDRDESKSLSKKEFYKFYSHVFKEADLNGDNYIDEIELNYKLKLNYKLLKKYNKKLSSITYTDNPANSNTINTAPQNNKQANKNNTAPQNSKQTNKNNTAPQNSKQANKNNTTLQDLKSNNLTNNEKLLESKEIKHAEIKENLQKSLLKKQLKEDFNIKESLKFNKNKNPKKASPINRYLDYKQPEESLATKTQRLHNSLEQLEMTEKHYQKILQEKQEKWAKKYRKTKERWKKERAKDL